MPALSPIRALVVSMALTVALALPLVASGAQVPRIAGVTLDGKQLTLKSLRGKPVMINVWSSW